MLSRPTHLTVHETPLSSFWLDEDGVLNIVTKKTNVNLDNLTQHLNSIKSVTNGQKVCCLATVQIQSVDKASRELTKKEVGNLIKANALLTNSSLAKMIATVLFVIISPKIPTKLFTDKEEARKWLIKYI